MRRSDVYGALTARFGTAPEVPDAAFEGLIGLAARGSCRRFLPDPVPSAWIDCLAAVALSAPTKSDLQQRDIIVLQSVEQRKKLVDLVAGQEWLAAAPLILVFCGNNRRQRQLHDWHGTAFANDHLDAVINATGDAALALGAFVTAAEAVGLGCCPISAVRNEAGAVSELLGLPKHVFPFAGLAVGYPADPPQISMRLPMAATYHVDRFSDVEVRTQITAYDAARASAQPYPSQRAKDQFGPSDPYTWSEDKVRQYSQPERADFGAYLRGQGFNLD